MRGNPLRALSMLTAAVLGLLVPAVAAAEPTTPPPTIETTEATETPPPSPAAKASSVYDLTMTATFDKPSYNTGEQVTVTVTVTNTGAEPMTARADFFYYQPDLIQINLDNPFVTGEWFTLAGGASITRTITGAMHNPDIATGTLYGFLVEKSGAAELHTFTVPIVQTRTHVAGVVYYDEDRNGKYDDGEGQAGVKLTLSNQYHYETKLTATTDANGLFRFTNVPTGPYGVSGEGNGQLVVGYTRMIVGASGVDGLQLRGAAPLAQLIAKVEFTKDAYAPDEAPVVRVTLENLSEERMTGIVASCNRAGMSWSLDGTGDGWGDLARDGVALAKKSKLVLEVTEPMPPRAYQVGQVMVDCEFGLRGVESQFNPASWDNAAVPGLRNNITGTVQHGDVGVAGVRLMLLPDMEFVPDPACAIVAETTTGADGTFAFQQVPVGIYMVYLFPPPGWRAEHDNPSRIDVVGDRETGMGITVVPGAAAPPTLPSCLSSGGAGPGPATAAAPAATAPQSARVPVLAHTGASVLGPGVAGMLALLVGIGLVFVARRRPAL
jgi:hypothetical protein